MPAHAIQNSHPAVSIAALLDEARARTLSLLEGLSEDDLHRQHDPLMSPIIWDLGHIAHFEELWLTRNLDGAIEFSEMPGIYNPLEHPRASRAALPMPPLTGMLDRLSQIRERVLDRLEGIDLDVQNPLLRDGYVYHMVLQHEYQHNETILQTLQMKQGEPYHPPRASVLPDLAESVAGPAMVEIPAGVYEIGTDDRTVSYDNERPRHQVRLEAFRIDRIPVTNGAYLEFIDDGGYDEQRLWSDAGHAWLKEIRVSAPKHWTRTRDGWATRGMDRVSPVDPARPVCHVSFHEAEAFARWAGKRLPTELEWEVAASWDPALDSARLFPWGDEPASSAVANVDHLTFGTARVASYPANVSPFGCHGMIGDVWEWTSSTFAGYAGFESYPYREYSETFFGSDYNVLRGGSWATRPGAIRNTFRNWDYPIRRQIFSGFRCAQPVNEP